MLQLDKIVRWAEKNPSVNALLLSGSLAGRGRKDIFSDYDIAVYGNNFDFIDDDEWLKQIGNYLVCIHDNFEFLSYPIPTRLTIFDDISKVDFSFHPVQLLQTLTELEKLPDDYNIGYRILLDKDGTAARLKAPTFTGFVIKKPSPEEFENNVKEFWFEIYHVAKYLSRGDLWTAKWRAWAAKKFLLSMLEWNHAIKARWKFSPKKDGKNMKDWVDKKIWKELEDCFGRFDKRDSWKALQKTIKLYQRIAPKTAEHLKYPYDQKLDHGISKFIKKRSWSRADK